MCSPLCLEVMGLHVQGVFETCVFCVVKIRAVCIIFPFACVLIIFACILLSDKGFARSLTTSLPQ